MKTIWMLWMSVLMLGVATAGELPEVYKPYEKLLGTWEGEIVSEVSVDEGDVETLRSKIRETYRYDEELEAIVGGMLISVEGDEEQMKITSRFLIVWDEKSERFKCMTWTPGSSATLFLVTYEDGVFQTISIKVNEHYDESVTSYVGPDGLLYSEGVLKISNDKPVEIKLKSVLKKVKP